MRHLSLFLLAVVSSLSLSAATTYDFSSSIPLGWVSDPDPKGYETSGEARGTQYEKSATLTLSGVSDVTSVTIVASCNYDKDPNSYTLAVTVGNKQFGSYTLQKVTNETYTFSGEAADGDLVVTITKNGTKKSLWIKSITVEGNVPEPENPADRLDPEYIYDEPTVIEPKDELGKMALDTIINNVLLTCPFGAYYTTDIRVMAGNTITFTATQPIKAIRIDGGVKKAFEAEASAGFLTYRVDYENDIESASPVLLIMYLVNRCSKSILLILNRETTSSNNIELKMSFRAIFLNSSLPNDKIPGIPPKLKYSPYSSLIESSVSSILSISFLYCRNSLNENG